MSRPTYFLFNPTLEKINLYLPVFFLFMVGLELFYIQSLFTNYTSELSFVAQIFLLNTVHIVFTFIFILFVPEFKNFIHIKKLNENKNLFLKWFGVFTFLFVGFLIFFGLLEKNPGLNHNGLYIFIPRFLIVLFGIHHNITQSVGLSLLQYSTEIGKKINNRESLIKYDFKAKYVLFAVLFLSIIHDFFLKNENNLIIKLSLVSIITIYIVRYLYLLRDAPVVFKKTKAVFLLRYLVYGLTPFSLMAVVARSGTHGIEYLMLTEKVLNNKNETLPQLKKLFIFLIILMFFLIAVVGFKFGAVSSLDAQRIPHGLLEAMLHSFFAASSLTHFYIDSFLYKFSDKVVYENQGKLILDNK